MADRELRLFADVTFNFDRIVFVQRKGNKSEIASVRGLDSFKLIKLLPIGDKLNGYEQKAKHRGSNKHDAKRLIAVT